MESQRNCSVRDLLRSAREAVKDEPPAHSARGAASTQGKKSPRVPPAGGLSKINRHISPPPQPQHRCNDLETADARRVHSAPSPTPHGREQDDSAEMPLPPPPGQAQPFAVYATNDGEATGFDSSSSDDDEVSSEMKKAPEAKPMKTGNTKTPRSGHDDTELPTTTEHQEVSSKRKTGQPRAPATVKPSASGESPRKGMGTSPPPASNETVVARSRVGGSATQLPSGFSTDPKVAEARSQLEAVLRGETNTAANQKNQHNKNKKPREGTEKKGAGAGAAGGQLFGETARTIASGGALLNLNRQFGSSEEDAAARAARKLMGLDEASRGAEGGDIASAASMTVAEACKPLGDLMPIDVTDRIHSLHSRVGEIGNTTNVPDSGSVGSPAPSPASPTTGAEEAGALVVRSGNSPPRAPLDGGAQESSPTTDQRREADAILQAFLSTGNA